VIADDACRDEIVVLVNETMTRLSIPDSILGELFTHPDMTIVGSRVGEFYQGQASVQALAKSATNWGFTWTCEEIVVWREGDVAWAQILLSIDRASDENHETVPYRIVGVFAFENGSWHWRHWGGSQPRVADAP
jgi:ketosteroid isomerase-like protein